MEDFTGPNTLLVRVYIRTHYIYIYIYRYYICIYVHMYMSLHIYIYIYYIHTYIYIHMYISLFEVQVSMATRSGILGRRCRGRRGLDASAWVLATEVPSRLPVEGPPSSINILVSYPKNSYTFNIPQNLRLFWPIKYVPERLL